MTKQKMAVLSVLLFIFAVFDKNVFASSSPTGGDVVAKSVRKEAKRVQSQRKRSKQITKELLIQMIEYQSVLIQKKHGVGIIPPGLEDLPDLPSGVTFVALKQVALPPISHDQNQGDTSVLSSPV